MANVTQGFLMVHVEGESREAEDGIMLASQGTILVPMVSIVPGRDANAASSVLSHIFGYNAAIPADNSLLTTSGGRLVPCVSVVTDFRHHLDLLHGDDTPSREAC